MKMTVLRLDQAMEMRDRVIDWTATWDWCVGTVLADRLRAGRFIDGFERLFLALSQGQPVGCCTLEQRDGVGLAVSPFIATVYTDPAHRGQRISHVLCCAAEDYARSLGFEAV
ncbi:MAG: GNAT family N-acetyltransferase [Oscillospiraceae bacterium]|jgi:GNAT superfamily N-acetyltransferase|nr:GNAT family N-acetyltransferase [Oscillospiraceae bacterium]